ncbi:PAP2 superfamily protein [Saccharicrinis carchari]|uniref:PAP2 superfamily protein n=1 Tax=Saccharicrinis carchari TaxID=1168039 RepID=A0A521C1N8_SACCC|nr:phosphatase PAP2 family protein [Saccharicrinis carchari]SMO53294.1 PAP2 superfamily protein [Saccharicrinis carchari]
MRLDKKKDFKILALFCSVSILLVALTFVLPLNGAVSYSEYWAPVWVAVTHTGSATGVSVIILVFSILFGLRYKNIKQGLWPAVLTLVLLATAVGGTALFNEFVFKERLKVYRPSILQLEKYDNLDATEFYGQNGKAMRRAFLKNHLDNAHGERVYLDGKPLTDVVLTEWVRSVGYSFPSGHSVSAFLLVTLIAYYLFIRNRLKKIWIPGALYLWAVVIAYSRVLIGVHSPTDISLGALWGSTIAFTLIATGLLDKLWKDRPTV